MNDGGDGDDDDDDGAQQAVKPGQCSRGDNCHMAHGGLCQVLPSSCSLMLDKLHLRKTAPGSSYPVKLMHNVFPACLLLTQLHSTDTLLAAQLITSFPSA